MKDVINMSAEELGDCAMDMKVTYKGVDISMCILGFDMSISQFLRLLGKRRC